MTPHDLPGAQAHGARGAHVVHLAVAQKLGTHVVRQTHPTKQAQEHQQQTHAGREHGRENDQQIQLGHGAPNLDEALEHQVNPTAKKALNGPGDHPQHHAREGQGQSDQHAHPKTVNQLRQHIAPTVVGAQPIGRRGWRGVGLGGEVVQRFGPVGVGREDRPIARLGQTIADEGVQKIGGGFKVAAERGLGVVLPHRRVPLALVTHHQGLVARNQLGHQAQHHQHHKHHQAVEAQAVAAKARPSAARGAGAVGEINRI